MADESDANLLADLGRRTFRETFSDSNKAEDMDPYLNATFAVDRILDELRQPSTTLFIAEISTQPVGFAKLEASSPLPYLRAGAFYERWGFRPVGTEIFRLGADDQVDLLMELRLAEVGRS